ncbi:MAG TPA: hypothetical protein VHR47_10090 [Bacillota bacterium]|nr:hypothetical protein [Bacillota bacterium]
MEKLFEGRQALVMVADGSTAAEILALQPVAQNLPGLERLPLARIIDKYDRTYFIPIGPKQNHPRSGWFCLLDGLF